MASAQDKASASANAHASASGLLSVPVLLPMRVPGTCCHRVRDFGTAYILALVEFKFLSVAQLVLVSDIASGCLEKDPCLSHGQAAPNSNEALQTLWE